MSPNEPRITPPAPSPAPPLACVPILSPGTHLHPDDGACLMEYVSVLAGETFSDDPPCTPVALAIVARLVNDAMSDSARQSLARRAPGLIIRPGRPAPEPQTAVGPRAAAELAANPADGPAKDAADPSPNQSPRELDAELAALSAPSVVLAVLDVVRNELPHTRASLESHHRRAGRRLHRLGVIPRGSHARWHHRLSAWLYLRGPVNRALATATRLATRDSSRRDQLLGRMLDAAMAAQGLLEDQRRTASTSEPTMVTD